jgi:hypothetical protein
MVSHFLLPSPLDRFPFLLTNLELAIEAFNGHERVLYGSLHGDPELALLLAKLEGDPFQHLRKFIQDLQGDLSLLEVVQR